MNYYKILQVSEEAEIEVIEAAYKRLSLKYHPDKNKSPEAEMRMKELNEAYSVLRNPVSRREYDELLSQQSSNQTNLPQVSSEPNWLETILNVAVTVNESLGTPCPGCGTKSLIHEKKLDKSIFDYVTGTQKYKCRNCGYIYSE